MTSFERAGMVGSSLAQLEIYVKVLGMTSYHLALLSHASVDDPICLPLVEQIKLEIGFTNELPPIRYIPGKHFPQAMSIRGMENALETCTALVVLLTPNAKKARGVRYEIGRFRQRMRTEKKCSVVVVKLRPCRRPWSLIRYLCIDGTKLTRSETARAILTSLEFTDV